MIECPCCGDEMSRELVVCWSCYRASNRLTPGSYASLIGTSPRLITTHMVSRWDAERSQRLGAS